MAPGKYIEVLVVHIRFSFIEFLEFLNLRPDDKLAIALPLIQGIVILMIVFRHVEISQGADFCYNFACVGA